MAKARALDKRRKSIKNIRKITRTMEMIATARYKQALTRAESAGTFTKYMGQMLLELGKSGTEIEHPLLEVRPEIRRVKMLVLTGNRGLCGGYNGNVVRLAVQHYRGLTEITPEISLEVSGKKGLSFLKFRKFAADQGFTHFEDKPSFDEVDQLAARYLDEYTAGEFDRLDVVYTQLESMSKQTAVVRSLLPLTSLIEDIEEAAKQAQAEGEGIEESGPGTGGESMYEFLPSAESIVNEVVPTGFRVMLFNCFLDAAVSEQIARMLAMKSATENADDIIKHLSMTYNRARQTQITSELMDISGGVEAMSN